MAIFLLCTFDHWHYYMFIVLSFMLSFHYPFGKSLMVVGSATFVLSKEVRF